MAISFSTESSVDSVSCSAPISACSATDFSSLFIDSSKALLRASASALVGALTFTSTTPAWPLLAPDPDDADALSGGPRREIWFRTT